MTFSGLPGPEKASKRQTQAAIMKLNASQIKMRVISATPLASDYCKVSEQRLPARAVPDRARNLWVALALEAGWRNLQRTN